MQKMQACQWLDIDAAPQAYKFVKKETLVQASAC